MLLIKCNNYIFCAYCTFYDAIDDDECEQNNGGCGQICNNTLGSYRCLCNEGYSLDLDGFNCIGKAN